MSLFLRFPICFLMKLCSALAIACIFSFFVAAPSFGQDKVGKAPPNANKPSAVKASSDADDDKEPQGDDPSSVLERDVKKALKMRALEHGSWLDDKIRNAPKATLE